MKYEISVENIKCGGCANSVKRGLLLNQKVKDVAVDLEAGLITLEASADLDLESIKQDLRKLGYPEKNTENNLVTKAVSYLSCAIGKIGK